MQNIMTSVINSIIPYNPNAVIIVVSNPWCYGLYST